MSQKRKVSFRWGRCHLLIHSFILSCMHLLSISYLLIPSICSEYVVSYSVLGTKDADIRNPSSVSKEFTVWRGSRGTWVLETDQTGTQPRLEPSLGVSLATTSQPGCWRIKGGHVDRALHTAPGTSENAMNSCPSSSSLSPPPSYKGDS